MKKEKTMPMPTGSDISAIGIALSHAGRLNVLESNSALFGKDMTIEIQNKTVRFFSKNGKTVVFLPGDESGVSTSKSNADKLYTFILCKISEEHLGKNGDYQISFHLNELVEYGIFKSVRSARQGFREIAHYLSGVRVSSSRRITKSDLGDEGFVPFPKYSIRKGICTIKLDNDVRWDIIAKPFINLPKEAFALSSPAFKIVKPIYRYIRVDCRSERFTMPLGYIMAKSGITVETQNPKRTITTLQNAVKEINECPGMTVSVVLALKNGKNINDTLYHSALVVSPRTSLIRDMKRMQDIHMFKHLESTTKSV